jgi:hypothetical protein
MSFAQDPDDLYGDAPIAKIEILCRRNGSLSVSGSIDDLHYSLAILDNARDAIKAFHRRRTTNGHGAMIVPSCDVAL